MLRVSHFGHEQADLWNLGASAFRPFCPAWCLQRKAKSALGQLNIVFSEERKVNVDTAAGSASRATLRWSLGDTKASRGPDWRVCVATAKYRAQRLPDQKRRDANSAKAAMKMRRLRHGWNRALTKNWLLSHKLWSLCQS